MTFFKKLLGGFAVKKKAPVVHLHEGFEIIVDPQRDGDLYRLAAHITKEIDGEQKQHFLIRADVFPSKEEAENASLLKAKRLIDEQGDAVFIK